MVFRLQPSVDPMLHILGQARTRAPPGGLLLYQPRVDLLKWHVQPVQVCHTHERGGSRFRMESGLFSSVFVTPQGDDSIADINKTCLQRFFISRTEVNHWATSLGPL